MEFRWAAAVAANITGIAPGPTAAQRATITNAIFGANPTAPLELPRELDLMPCTMDCKCVGIQRAPWTPNQLPTTVTKDVVLVVPGLVGSQGFTVTLTIPANLRQGIGRCE